MKFGIDIGHNCPPDTGANKIKQEDKLTKEVGTKVIEKLKLLGHQVVNCTPSQASTVRESLAKRVQTANSQNVDVFVSIHFNAFNGQAHGTEVFAVSDKGRRIAKSVLENIVNLGFVNRKVKDGSHLYVVRNTNMPAILVECCFCDSVADMNRYDGEAMANAIVKGLTGQLPSGASRSLNGDSQVLELQKSFNRLKVTDDSGNALEENGVIGAATEAATHKFHSLVEINGDGAASPMTWDAIAQIFDKPRLRVNHADGAVVRYVQFRVGTDVDGVYEDSTATAVEQFQTQQGLTADGIVDSQTWEKLIG